MFSLSAPFFTSHLAGGAVHRPVRPSARPAKDAPHAQRTSISLVGPTRDEVDSTARSHPERRTTSFGLSSTNERHANV